MIGSGIDGVVYNYQDKILKLSINYNLNYSFEPLNYLINNPIDCFVKLYSYQLCGTKDSFIYYYSIMEKLIPLSLDEEKIFHTILSHEDSNKVKQYSNIQLKKIVKELSLGLEFDQIKVLKFVEQYNNCKIVHHDIHQRNIMKDINNNFKFIDLDRLTIKGE
jgi:hypothetical protein